MIMKEESIMLQIIINKLKKRKKCLGLNIEIKRELA